MNISEQARALIENIIIVHLQYQSSDVEVIVQDIRYSFSDKIANFGGVFGIWAELTGFSLLGIINVCVIVLKVLLRCLKNWKKPCLSNSNDESSTKLSHAQDPNFRKAPSPVLEESPSPEQTQSPTFEEGLENASNWTALHSKIPRPVQTQGQTFMEEHKPEPEPSPSNRLRPKNPTSVTQSLSKTPPPFFF